MAARRRKGDLASVLISLGTLVVVLVWLQRPEVLRGLPQIVGFIVSALIILALCGVAFLLLRKLLRGRGSVGFQNPGTSGSFGADHGATQGAISEIRPEQLLDQLRSIDWFQFEKVIAVLYRKLGYGVTRRGGANADGGIDLVLEKEAERIAVQCKQWKTWNVGVRPVREFLGAMTAAGISQGKLVTLCGYTDEARQLAARHEIELLNEPELAGLLQAANAGYDPDIWAILNDPRKYCPKCEAEMVLRTATRGLNAGQRFWGCSAYPRCRFTMPASAGPGAGTATLPQ